MHLKKQYLIQISQMFLSIPQCVLFSFEVSSKRYYIDNMRLRAFSVAGVIGIGASGRILNNSIDDVIVDILLTVTM